MARGARFVITGQSHYVIAQNILLFFLFILTTPSQYQTQIEDIKVKTQGGFRPSFQAIVLKNVTLVRFQFCHHAPCPVGQNEWGSLDY